VQILKSWGQWGRGLAWWCQPALKIMWLFRAGSISVHGSQCRGMMGSDIERGHCSQELIFSWGSLINDQWSHVGSSGAVPVLLIVEGTELW